MRATEPIRRRYPNHRRKFSSNIPGEAMRPPSASNRDPFDRRALLVALASSELAGVAETARARGLGDVWQLGDHRILCGDATSEAAFDSLMDGERAHVVFVDPPYNVPIDGHVSGKGKIRHREFAQASGDLSREEFTRLLTGSCALLAKYSGNGAIHYVCMDWRHADDLLAAGRNVYSELKNIVVWVKSSAGMGSLYRSQAPLRCKRIVLTDDEVINEPTAASGFKRKGYIAVYDIDDINRPWARTPLHAYQASQELQVTFRPCSQPQGALHPEAPRFPVIANAGSKN